MYAKIFRQIYEGTLCTRGPWQALVTFQQLLILADRFGIVDMTAEAIARITTVPPEIINIGIAALEQTDSESRSDVRNGRRIVRLRPHTEWGWQIVNYEHFSKLRSAEDRKAYQREYYEQTLKPKRSQHKSTTSTLSTESTPHTHTQTHKTLAPSGAFVDFWNACPRKKSKGQALKAWKALAPTSALIIEIMDGLARAKTSPDWTKNNGQFIPHPATWLNARGWEDEAQPKAEWKFVV